MEKSGAFYLAGLTNGYAAEMSLARAFVQFGSTEAAIKFHPLLWAPDPDRTTTYLVLKEFPCLGRYGPVNVNQRSRVGGRGSSAVLVCFHYQFCEANSVNCVDLVTDNVLHFAEEFG